MLKCYEIWGCAFMFLCFYVFVAEIKSRKRTLMSSINKLNMIILKF